MNLNQALGKLYQDYTDLTNKFKNQTNQLNEEQYLSEKRTQSKNT
jgi:hypothetical protein